MSKFLYKFLPKGEKGQDLAEYGMLIGLIALIVVGAVTLVGTDINDVFTAISNALPW